MLPTALPPFDVHAVGQWLGALGFEAPPPGSSVWRKQANANGYTITVDTKASGKINYGSKIQVERATTTNLLDAENLVVLDCVVALLHAGYPPAAIVLEQPFQLGRTKGGYLDILVKNQDQTYVMIECKTAGTEYSGAVNALLTKPDSQLMSYLQQDRDARHCVLYTSHLVPGKFNTHTIERNYTGFSTELLVGNNISQLFSSWDKVTFQTGLFESQPYNIEERELRVSDLQDMTLADGNLLINDFKEILRRHAVSDHPNAFNKLFNLFVCKIVDEDKVDPTAVIEFQWRSRETSTTVLDRLSELYQRGMTNYLRLDVADHSASHISGLLAGLPDAQRSELLSMIVTMRQYNSTNFTFIDVYDSISFEANSVIVRDIVRMLERRRLRYTEKHGFMGMFFEKLLSTGLKQESGQYFTPPPIAQFVNECLPIEQIISSKLEQKQVDFLPFAIDYAAGSGHFLTEYMDRVDKVLQSLPATAYREKAQRQKAVAWANDYSWAEDFVYGIELDYRLAKAAKVSTFLNGDGNANVIRGNGLAHFQLDPDFKLAGPRLWHPTKSGQQDLGTFDVVVANPPYSVSDFQASIPNGSDAFSLWKNLGQRSRVIEALFLERTKQLLSPGGVAGIILPTSFLSNNGVEAHARRLLLRHFHLVACVSLGGSVFVATDTPTTIVFLRRRSDDDCLQIDHAIATFLEKGLDSVVLGKTDAIAAYAQATHQMTLSQYYDALSAPLAAGSNIFTEMPSSYENSGRQPSKSATTTTGVPTLEFLSYVRTNERARLEAWLLNQSDYSVVVNAPQPKVQKRAFLGYTFSERRKHEGIRILGDSGLIETPLFDPTDTFNPDKISTVVRGHFNGQDGSVPSALAEWVDIVPTVSLLQMHDAKFDWVIANAAVKITHTFNVPTKSLGSVCQVAIGGSPSSVVDSYYRGSNPWVQISDMHGSTITTTAKSINDAAVVNSNVKLVAKGTLLLSFKLSIGKTGIAGVDLYTNEAIAAITPKPAPDKDEAWIDTDYLHVLFRLFPDELMKSSQRGAKKIGQSMNTAQLRTIRIPLMSSTERTEICSIGSDESLTVQARRAAIAHRIWKVDGE